MAIKRKTTSQLQRTKGLDFRSPDDDAWYSVRLLKVKEGVLRVMYVNFPEDSDEWFYVDQFKNAAQIEELFGRFRRPAEQLQDSQCREVTPGMVVVASHTPSNREIMFFDATVNSVSRPFLF
jgi:SAWADEE domain